MLLLQDAQQLGLQVTVQFADFVQEQRAAVARGRGAAGSAREGAFSCPNISLSISDGESAAQLTATKIRCARGLFAWMQRAMSSLPVPLSPVISTVALVGATLRAISRTSRHSGSPRDRAAARSARSVPRAATRDPA